MTPQPIAVIATVLVALVSAACLSSGGSGGGGAGDGSSGPGSCPQLAGAWTITEHCEASLIGVGSTVTQSGCSYTTTSGDFVCDGTIMEDGELSHACTSPDGSVVCSGSADGDAMQLECDGCIVRLEAQ